MKPFFVALLLIVLVSVGVLAIHPVLDLVEFPLLVRDWTIASIARVKAGEKVPYEFDYSLSAPYDSRATYGMETNSLYLAEWTRKIVPFYTYEGAIEDAIYPSYIYFVPQPGQKSFHNLGTAAEQEIIRINERFVLDKWRLDERQMLSTLVHELGHIQGGDFMGGPPNWLESFQFESKTQSATIEILAAMCNYGDDLACSAFWDEIYSYARGSFRMRLRRWGMEDLYYPLARIFWWDDSMEMRADKSLRYWMQDEDRSKYLYTIIYQYQQLPWQDHVVQGILGKPMSTGLLGHCEYSASGEARCQVNQMNFDDTRYVLGDFLVSWISWFTP